MDLPRFILLKSTNNEKYLRYRKEDDANHAFLQFSQDEKEVKPEIQFAKFEIQKSENVKGFVHIRSCYNNKYWVRKSGDERNSIVAEANEPEEDQSKASCTLFKPVPVEVGVDGPDVNAYKLHTGEPQKVRLVHTDRQGQLACIARANADLLALGDGDEQGSRTSGDVFLAYDATSVFVLPDRVAFVNHTDQYGAVTTLSGVTYLEFKTSDIGRAGVPHELTQWTLAQPQLLRVRNTSSGWWVVSGNFMLLQNTPNSAVYLTPVRLGGNLVALRNASSTSPLFASCGSGRGMEHALGMAATSISEYAMFGVEEPLRYRQVSNVNFNIGDSRIYNVSSIEKFKDERRNSTSVEQTGSFSVEYKVTQTKTWSDSVSVTRSIQASWSSSIPYVGSFGVELSEERNQTVSWGTEQSDERTVKYDQNVTVPPGKKVTMLVVATRAQCDVPFTCRVVDTVTDGTTSEYTKTDGLFLGVNEYNFVTQLFEEDL